MARVLVLQTAGTNCDEETAWAFRLAGADVECLHVGVLISGRRRLDEFDILSFPGGFSYGDDLGAGTVLANRLRSRLEGSVREFVDAGKLVIGICNGFQVLVRLGILPGRLEGAWSEEHSASLIENCSGKFEDRWVALRVTSRHCAFLPPGEGDQMRLPVAHREGRLVLRDAALLDKLEAHGQIALRYCRETESGNVPAEGIYPANPNGSTLDIAGLSNRRGNVLGLMPHPERFLSALNDPQWTRRHRSADGGALDPTQIDPEDLARAGDGYRIFEAAVRRADSVDRVEGAEQHADTH